MTSLNDFISTGCDHLYWYYNINDEEEWSKSKVFPSVLDAQQMELIIQQEQQLLYIANKNDTILLRHKPNEEFLAYLRQNNIEFPKLKYVDNNNTPFDFIEEKSISLFIPYLVVGGFLNRGMSEVIKVFGANEKLVKQINNKIITRKLAEKNGFKVTSGFICKNINDLQQAYDSLNAEGFRKFVMKIPYGSSGKGLQIIENDKTFNMVKAYIKKRKNHFNILLEGWHNIKRSLNSQILIKDSNIKILGITEQRIDKRGSYLGTNFTPNFDENLLNNYKIEILKMAKILMNKGYEGIIGIDSITDMDNNLYPIIEVNARFTQVTYLLPLIQKLQGNGYRHIESRMIRFETNRKLSFEYINNYIKENLRPTSNNNYLIYTFAEKETNNKMFYKIFVLLYGNNQGKIKEMLNDFRDIKFTNR